MRLFVVGLLVLTSVVGTAAQQAGSETGEVTVGSSYSPLTPRITGVIESLPLSEAAARFGEWIGVPVHPSILRNDGVATRDLQRRASLRFKGTPVSEAMRAFCRAYHCSFVRGRGGFDLSAMPLPSGPEVAAGSFKVGINWMRNSKTILDLSGNSPRRESTRVELRVRSDSAISEQSRLCRIESLVAYDDTGRSAVGHYDKLLMSGRLLETVIPDEFSQTIMVVWDGPPPRKITRVEGTLSLYGSFSTSELRVPLTPANGRLYYSRDGLQVGPTGVRRTADGKFECSLRVHPQGSLDLFPAGSDKAPVVVLPNGERVAARMSRFLYPLSGFQRYTDFVVSATGVTSFPTAVHCSVLLQSDPLPRIPFTITDPPEDLWDPPSRPILGDAWRLPAPTSAPGEASEPGSNSGAKSN